MYSPIADAGNPYHVMDIPLHLKVCSADILTAASELARPYLGLRVCCLTVFHSTCPLVFPLCKYAHHSCPLFEGLLWRSLVGAKSTGLDSASRGPDATKGMPNIGPSTPP